MQDPHLDVQAKRNIIAYLGQKVIGKCTQPLS